MAEEIWSGKASYLSFPQKGLLSQFCRIVVVNCASSKELFETFIQVLQILKAEISNVGALTV